ncbi:unnamed protein product [Prunus armeniaca]
MSLLTEWRLLRVVWMVFGRKVGTKSKVNAKGSRISLNDISTNNLKENINKNVVCQKAIVPPKINYEELTAKGKAVIGGKLVVNKLLLLLMGCLPMTRWTLLKRTYERVDRAMCNLAWRAQFAEANVKHLGEVLGNAFIA